MTFAVSASLGVPAPCRIRHWPSRRRASQPDRTAAGPSRAIGDDACPALQLERGQRALPHHGERWQTVRRTTRHRASPHSGHPAA